MDMVEEATGLISILLYAVTHIESHFFVPLLRCDQCCNALLSPTQNAKTARREWEMQVDQFQLQPLQGGEKLLPTPHRYEAIDCL